MNNNSDAHLIFRRNASLQSLNLRASISQQFLSIVTVIAPRNLDMKVRVSQHPALFVTCPFAEERIIGSAEKHESEVETGDIFLILPGDSVSRGAFRNLAQ